MGPPAQPDVYAPWADSGIDTGARVDADIDAFVDPTIDAFSPSRPDAGMSSRECMAEEVCGNGVDDDCTGEVDDGCACEAGTTSPCFRGDPTHRGLGVCADGTMACEGTEFGRWTSCSGDVLESAEICDEAGLDEDCDGVSNEGCECSGDSVLPCGTDEGECVAGVQRCVSGMRTECEGATGPVAETCDGLDEDCDGSVDEGLTRRCGFDRGICIAGAETCAVGSWGDCAGAVLPVTEVCNGLDDDCDGMTDELLTRACGTDVGACVAGTESCSGGAFGDCVGETAPTTESCNGEDDDCDGLTDESLVRGCGTDVGDCVAGHQTCVGGAYGACDGAVMPASEICDGAHDENCNGTTDEGCSCTTGATRSCGTDTGHCVAGTQTCDGTGNWGMCAGSIDPRSETCDGTDDDCDGLTDEGCDCVTGTTRPCGTDVGECVAGRETCDVLGHWGVCTGSTGPSTEICNGRDDNCDGFTDEGDVCPRVPPAVMCPGPLSATVGSPLSLDAVAFDPDGGSVSVAWSVSSRPAGSSANPSPPTAMSTSFTPDAAGSFTLLMCATDDEAQSACCTSSITAVSPCTPPTAPALVTACGTSWDRRPIVEFAPLPAGVQYELFLDGAPSPYGTVTMVGQNYFRPAAPIAAGGPPPGTSHSISVRACRTSDPTCCAYAPGTLSVSMVEECTTPIAANETNILISEYLVAGTGGTPQVGEAFEVTNLSHCPVTLNGAHFSYCNFDCTPGSARYMNFGAADVIPPRGVYVAMREPTNPSGCGSPGVDDPGLFGLRVSTLVMLPTSPGGWFENTGGGTSRLRIASGSFSTLYAGTTFDLISPYQGESMVVCRSTGYDARDVCGTWTTASADPLTRLLPHQLGRLWHPCDAVVSPVPSSCR
ncbi:MAG: hypothetical protein K1X94_20605 [Sandaracinaceae bacterium]|nr:hypothetical protein [Sandaracinaceae bacterium]